MKIEARRDILENIISWIALSLLASALIGCAGPQGEPGESIVGPPGDRGQQGPPGRDGEDGRDGVDGRDGLDAVVEVIDPCGKQSDYDEMIFRLADGRLMAYFERSGKRFLTIIPAGTYVTTDSTSCQFTVTADGRVE